MDFKHPFHGHHRSSSSSRQPVDDGNNFHAPPAYSSSSHAPTTNYPTQFASLSLHSMDKLRLLSFPPQIVSLLRTTIQTHYVFGIQSEKSNYGGSHEFKLKSYPWAGQGKDAIPSRILVRECLRTLYEEGWKLVTGLDVSRKEADGDMLVFRYEEHSEKSSPRNLEWASVSLNEYDKLRLISASTTLHQAFSSFLTSRGAVTKEGWKDKDSNEAWEFKFKGYPWANSGEDTMVTRSMILGLVNVLESEGWGIYAVVDQSGGGGSPQGISETDSWVIVRDRNWRRGERGWKA